jgi:hypothetical protein
MSLCSCHYASVYLYVTSIRCIYLPQYLLFCPAIPGCHTLHIFNLSSKSSCGDSTTRFFCCIPVIFCRVRSGNIRRLYLSCCGFETFWFTLEDPYSRGQSATWPFAVNFLVPHHLNNTTLLCFNNVHLACLAVQVDIPHTARHEPSL